MGINLISFVVVLGVLIFFHELGHFLLARAFGVGVEVFSLGFGPRIFGKRFKRTDYRISAVPLGGYVKMVGEEPDSKVDPEDLPYSFTHKHVLKRMLIVAAGPLFNILLSIIIFFFLFTFLGSYELKPVIGDVTAGSPAEKAGLLPRDTVIAIDGQKIRNWQEMAEIILGSNGKALNFTITRDGEILEKFIVPELKSTKNIFGEEVGRHVIGVVASGEVVHIKMGVLASAVQGVVKTYEIAELTVKSVVKIIQGKISPKTLGGPIMIAQLSGEQAKEGLASLAFFIALISVNLAILNFLPIPVLDGGHLLFFFIELILKRPVSLKVRETAQQAGLFILILLMVYVFYNDLARIFLS